MRKASENSRLYCLWLYMLISSAYAAFLSNSMQRSVQWQNVPKRDTHKSNSGMNIFSNINNNSSTDIENGCLQETNIGMYDSSDLNLNVGKVLRSDLTSTNETEKYSMAAGAHLQDRLSRRFFVSSKLPLRPRNASLVVSRQNRFALAWAPNLLSRLPKRIRRNTSTKLNNHFHLRGKFQDEGRVDTVVGSNVSSIHESHQRIAGDVRYALLSVGKKSTDHKAPMVIPTNHQQRDQFRAQDRSNLSSTFLPLSLSLPFSSISSSDVDADQRPFPRVLLNYDTNEDIMDALPTFYRSPFTANAFSEIRTVPLQSTFLPRSLTQQQYPWLNERFGSTFVDAKGSLRRILSTPVRRLPLLGAKRGKDDKKIIRDQERVGRKIALRKWWYGITSTAHKDTNMSNPLAAYSLTASHGTSNSLAGGNCSEPLSTENIQEIFHKVIGKDKMLLRSTEKVGGIFGVSRLVHCSLLASLAAYNVRKLHEIVNLDENDEEDTRVVVSSMGIEGARDGRSFRFHSGFSGLVEDRLRVQEPKQRKVALNLSGTISADKDTRWSFRTKIEKRKKQHKKVSREKDSTWNLSASVQEVESKMLKRNLLLLQRAVGISGRGDFKLHHVSSAKAAAVVCIASARNATIISFRGTKDAVDVLTDLTFLSVPFLPRSGQSNNSSPFYHELSYQEQAASEERPNIFSILETDQSSWSKRKNNQEEPEVHRGFFDAFMSVEKDVSRLLDAANTKHVLFVGHSMGGALAEIAAAYYFGEDSSDLMGNAQCTLVTTAAPSIGNKAFAQLLEKVEPKGGLHIYSSGDIVPFVGAFVGYFRGGVNVELPLSPSALDLFIEKNSAALVRGFSSIAPHVLVQVGEAIYTFWTFQGKRDGNVPFRGMSIENEQVMKRKELFQKASFSAPWIVRKYE